jgi:Pentapeptide repeats (8 copies)
VLLLWLVPVWEIEALEPARGVEAEERAKLTELRISSRASIGQTIAAILLIATLALTAYQASGARRAAEDARKAADRNSQIAYDSQVTERFARGVEELGARAPDVRVGALFSLARIGEDSARDTEPILLTIASYIRRNLPSARPRPLNTNNACLTPKRIERRKNPRADLRIALRYVLPHLGRDWRRQRLGPSGGLQFTDFRVMNLGTPSRMSPGALRFVAVDIEGSTFRDANISHSWFEGVNLDDVSFRDACLLGVNFTNSVPVITGLDLRGADLRYADVRHEFFRDAKVGARTHLRDIRVDGKPYPDGVPQDQLRRWISGS